MKNVALVPIAWPNMVARAPGKFLSFLRKIRLMKNINVLVGHAALLVVDEESFFYTDFGRYITPRAFGRARSLKTDPKLLIKTKPKWSNGELINLEEVFSEMELNSKATHGENELFASVIYNVDINKAHKYIDEIQNKGYLPYSGLNKDESNCARFVTNTILYSLEKNLDVYKRLTSPITISPTPFFNVLSSNDQGEYFIFHKGSFTKHQDSYRRSRKDVLTKLSYSFRTSKSKMLPTDIKEGQLDQPEIPKSLSKMVTYLGGIGEGAWYSIDEFNENFIQVTRYFYDGTFEFTNKYISNIDWLEKYKKNEVEITYDSHFAWITLNEVKTKKSIRLYSLQNGEKR